jgi:ketosteroid isomerase-like protein
VTCSLLLIALATVGVSPVAHGQTRSTSSDETAILSVVDRFMQAVSASDFAAIAKLRLDGSINIVEGPGEGGRTRVTRRVFNPDTAKRGDYRERYWDPIVHVRGSIAIVWTPYEFWQDGKTSHCGIDVFEMVKEQDDWRIANMMWTVEPDACPALRPSDPARLRPIQ